MKVVTSRDLEMDVLDGEYLEIPAKIYLNSGKVIEKPVNGYTHDEEPFRNYIEVEDQEIEFDEIKKIELMD